MMKQKHQREHSPQGWGMTMIVSVFLYQTHMGEDDKDCRYLSISKPYAPWSTQPTRVGVDNNCRYLSISNPYTQKAYCIQMRGDILEPPCPSIHHSALLSL